MKDPVAMARKALFEAGGIYLYIDRDKQGRMVPLYPEFQERADAYNALAELHAEKTPA